MTDIPRKLMLQSAEVVLKDRKFQYGLLPLSIRRQLELKVAQLLRQECQDLDKSIGVHLAILKVTAAWPMTTTVQQLLDTFLEGESRDSAMLLACFKNNKILRSLYRQLLQLKIGKSPICVSL